MVIVNIQGGLGNQMFCYSFGKWLENNGVSVKYNIDKYNVDNKNSKTDAIHNGYELERIFNIKLNYAENSEYKKMLDESSDIFNRIRRRLFGTKSSYISWYYLGNKNWYHEEFLNKDKVYYDGFWCSFKYADHIKNQLMHTFVFPIDTNALNLSIKAKIQGTESVSVHIRHGDYLKLSDMYCVLEKTYYIEAIEYLRSRVGQNVKFFCFSDDVEWCKKEFQEYDFTYIDWNYGEESYRDLELMSLCKHNIVANSTFSMWAAWLNKNKKKTVIRPKRTYVYEKDEWVDMWPTDWIMIEN